MRNEGPFVLDWVAHHRALGFGPITVFSDRCEDGTMGILDALALSGAITHRQCPPGNGRPQWRVLKSLEDDFLGQVGWFVHIDADEFLVLGEDYASVQDLLAALVDVDALAIPWRLFGHSGHLTFRPEPVTERFTMAAPQDIIFPAAGRFFKSLYNVGVQGFRAPGVHRPKQRKGAAPVWRDGYGRDPGWAFSADDNRILLDPASNELRPIVALHHYSVRSAEDFLVKRARGLPNRSNKDIDAVYWAERNFNSVEETGALRHKAGRDAERVRLMDNPDVRQAHETAVEIHQSLILDLLGDPRERELYSRIALLATSTPPDPNTARRLLKLIHSGPS